MLWINTNVTKVLQRQDVGYTGAQKSIYYKNKLFTKWMRTRNLKDENNYKSYLKVFKKVSLAAKTTFYKEKFDTRINNTKQLWTNLNNIGSLGKTKSNTNINEIIYNSEKFDKPQDICDKLKEYFCSVSANFIHSLNHVISETLRNIAHSPAKTACSVVPF